MQIVFDQTATLVIFVAIGYILGKLKIVEHKHSKILSQLLVYVFMPCKIWNTFSSHFTVAYIKSNYEIIVWSAVLIITMLAVSRFLAKLFTKDSYQRCVYEYSLLIPNCGYMGYALAGNILSGNGLINYMLFNLPAYMYIYSIGFAKLTKRGVSLKGFLNPSMIATFVGMLGGILKISLPSVLDNVCLQSSNCMGPASMLLAGIVVSEFKLKEIVNKARVYIVVLLRLIVIPAFMGTFLYFFADKDVMAVAVLFFALPCGLNTVVFPRLVDEDCKLGAGFSLVSTLLSCITIPLMLRLFGI